MVKLLIGFLHSCRHVQVPYIKGILICSLKTSLCFYYCLNYLIIPSVSKAFTLTIRFLLDLLEFSRLKIYFKKTKQKKTLRLEVYVFAELNCCNFY